MLRSAGILASRRAGAGANNTTVFPVGLQANGNIGGLLSVATGGNITFSIPGRAATGQVGAIAVGISANIVVPLLGRSATGRVGTPNVTPSSNVLVSLLGLAGQARVGNIGASVPSPSITVALAGIHATGDIGQLSGEIFAIDWKKQDIHLTGWTKQTKAPGG